jgi:hypothetical protein
MSHGLNGGPEKREWPPLEAWNPFLDHQSDDGLLGERKNHHDDSDEN